MTLTAYHPLSKPINDQLGPPLPMLAFIPNQVRLAKFDMEFGIVSNLVCDTNCTTSETTNLKKEKISAQVS